MLSLKFLKDAAERVIWTFAQSLLAAGVVLGGFFTHTNLKVAATAAVASALKAVVATRIGNGDSASTVK